MLGVEFALNAQEVPDPLNNLKPWVNDSTPAYKGYRIVSEKGVELRVQYYDIVRNAEENWVSYTQTNENCYTDVYLLDSCVTKEVITTKYFDDNQIIDSVIVVTIYKDSLGTELEYCKNSEIYNETGELVSRINFTNIDGVIMRDTSFIGDVNALCSEGSVVTQSNDTTTCCFSNEEYEQCKKYDKSGSLIYNSSYYSWGGFDICEKEYDEGRKLIREFLKRSYGSYKYEENLIYRYDSFGKLIFVDSYDSIGKQCSQRSFEYDSKGNLIRIVNENYQSDFSAVTDYCYGYKGNLTLEFNYSGKFYDGAYTVYDYDGGKKKFKPFDPKLYPTERYPQGSSVAKHGKLQVKGTNIVDVNGEIVQLKGISTHGISWFPECYSESSINSLVDDWGINVLRIASYAENQIKKEKGKDAEWHRTFIDSMVDICEQKGIYCIIDWHTLNDGTGDPWHCINQAKEFFEYMSKKHAGKAHVMYEICNEPNGDISWARIKSYAQEVIDVIVENDPNSIIIVGTPVWSQRIIAAADSPLDYPNAMYALHFYANDKNHKQSLRDDAVVALAKNCPIFVSEFGTCDSGGSGTVNVEETIKWFMLMNDNNISWVNWNFADKKESSSLLNEGSCEAEDWLNITNSGRIIKWALSDAELSRSDSVIVVEKALKDLRLFLNTDERKDYFQSCIHENKENIELMSSEDLRDCVYAKECVAENSDIANDATAINKCVREKRDGIEDVLATLEDVKVYPNSVEDYFTVACFSGDFKVSLIDLDGEMVVTQNCSKGECQLNISYLAPGVYLLVVENNGKCYYEKIVKE